LFADNIEIYNSLERDWATHPSLFFRGTNMFVFFHVTSELKIEGSTRQFSGDRLEKLLTIAKKKG